MQAFFSIACVAALICSIVFGIKAFKRKQKKMIIPFVVALAACVGAAMIASPPDDTAGTPEPSESVVVSEEPSPSPSIVSSEVPEPSEEPAPPPIPVSEVPSPTPAPSHTTEPTPTPEPSRETTIRGYSSDTVVYVSRSHKIHRVSDCSGMTHYTEMTLGEADSRGYDDYCDNCW